MKIETEQEYKMALVAVSRFMNTVDKLDKEFSQIKENVDTLVGAVEEYEKIHYPIDEPKYTEGQVRLALSKFGTFRNYVWDLSGSDFLWDQFMTVLNNIVINDESY